MFFKVVEEIQYLYCFLRDLSFYLVTSRVLAPIPHYYYFHYSQGKILYMCVETVQGLPGSLLAGPKTCMYCTSTYILVHM